MLKKGLYQGLFLLADFLWCCSRSKSYGKYFCQILLVFWMVRERPGFQIRFDDSWPFL